MHPIDMPHAAGSRRRASLSIIIPTYQEAGQIGRLIAYLHNHSPVEQVEIIVADGGSIDGTPQEARQAGADIVLHTAPGRAVQMNAGARLATLPCCISCMPTASRRKASLKASCKPWPAVTKPAVSGCVLTLENGC